MARAVQEMQWDKTLPGPAGGWPPELHGAPGICLNSHFPMAIAWGADELAFCSRLAQQCDWPPAQAQAPCGTLVPVQVPVAPARRAS